jgi:peroxiredoxin Q/BCP
MTLPAIGKKIPAFKLKNQNGDLVSSESILGSWTVLYFYPKDDTPGCTVEACEFTDRLPDFKKLSAKVFGISPDSEESHQKFIKKKSLKIDLLADEGNKFCEKVGVWAEKNMYGKKYMGVVRTTFLIDQEGKIAFVWEKVKAEGHAEEVKAKIKELSA